MSKDSTREMIIRIDERTKSIDERLEKGDERMDGQDERMDKQDTAILSLLQWKWTLAGGFVVLLLVMKLGAG